VLVLVAAIVALGALYVGLSFAAPREVPRLAIFPSPGGPVTFQQDCSGGDGRTVSEEWERTGPFWTLSTFRAGGGCLPE
jgi:hypothetical protein